jgi:hypothetical protein
LALKNKISQAVETRLKQAIAKAVIRPLKTLRGNNNSKQQSQQAADDLGGDFYATTLLI